MTATATSRSRRWWKWLGLAVAALLVAVIASGVWNYRHPLTLEGLSAARTRWKEKGPRSYTLRYTVSNHQNTVGDRYVVKVREGKTIEASINDRPEISDRFAYYGMERLYDYIDEFLRQCERLKKDGRPTAFHRGAFDSRTGALESYERRVLGEPQWLRIRVEGVE